MFYYLSTSKLHRNRANLIQTINTAQSLYLLTRDFLLYISPYKLSIPYKDRLMELGVCRDIPVKFSSLLHSRWKGLYYLPFLFFHKKELKKSKVFVRSLRLSMGLIKLKIPHVFEVHELEQLFEKDFFITIKKALLSGIILKLVAINKTLKRNLIKEGLCEDFIEVIPNGANLRSFSTISPLNKDRLKNPQIVHIGSLNVERGLKIIEALAFKGYKITVAGEIRGGGIPKNINYLGMVPYTKVPNLYHLNEISIIPYQPELDTINSFCSLKLIESMAAGRVIIASDLPPIRDIVTHEKEGILVPPKDISSWITAIERIKQEPEFGIYLAENARKKSLEFDYKKRAEKILSLF